MHQPNKTTKCGLWNWRPEFLQSFATPRCFMIVVSFLGMVQIMCFIYFSATLTTMEKRFKIPSKISGVILSGTDVSQVLLGIVLSFIGGQNSRPKWLAWSCLLCSLACFLSALPHIIYGAGEDALSLTVEHYEEYKNSTLEELHHPSKLCTLDEKSSCQENITIHSTMIISVIILFLSQFVMGIGNSVIFSLGNTYMDDNTKKDTTPLYIGYSMVLRALGPVFGFLLGPVFLSIYIAPTLTPLISHDDPRWMGAYWLGWIFFGSMMILNSFLIALFPKKLPKKKIIYSRPFVEPSLIDDGFTTNESNFLMERRRRNNIAMAEQEENNKSSALKDLLPTMKRLLTNKLFMANAISSLFYIMGGLGFTIYLAKYIEVQYNVSSVTSATITGPMAILGMLLGFLFSGWYISKKKPVARNLLAWSLLVTLIVMAGHLAYIFVSCDQVSLEKEIIENGKNITLNNCNSNCHCESVEYSPVCHRPTSQIYFSPCHAGCTKDFPQQQLFTNCSCLQVPYLENISINNDNITEEEWNTVHAGPCVRHCYKEHITFTVLAVILGTFSASSKISTILISYRSVEVRDKPAAQGLILLLVSLFGFVPSLVLFGAMIDWSCAEWGESCGSQGNCLLYNKDAYRIYLNVASILFLFLGFVAEFFLWHFSKTLDLYGEDEPLNENKPQLVYELRDSYYD